VGLLWRSPGALALKSPTSNRLWVTSELGHCPQRGDGKMSSASLPRARKFPASRRPQLMPGSLLLIRCGMMPGSGKAASAVLALHVQVPPLFARLHYQQPIAGVWRRKVARARGDDGHGGAIFAAARIEPGDVGGRRQGVEENFQRAILGHVNDGEVFGLGAGGGDETSRRQVARLVGDELGLRPEPPEFD